MVGFCRPKRERREVGSSPETTKEGMAKDGEISGNDNYGRSSRHQKCRRWERPLLGEDGLRWVEVEVEVVQTMMMKHIEWGKMEDGEDAGNEDEDGEKGEKI
ncbi:hypothetical protein PABG_11796 [Paracoccidioides brasiliensis Pb03]|nr:hypothetical protein PABG_11796 [Paracoccidioides brasiliensis Pb03]